MNKLEKLKEFVIKKIIRYQEIFHRANMFTHLEMVLDEINRLQSEPEYCKRCGKRIKVVK